MLKLNTVNMKLSTNNYEERRNNEISRRTLNQKGTEKKNRKECSEDENKKVFMRIWGKSMLLKMGKLRNVVKMEWGWKASK